MSATDPVQAEAAPRTVADVARRPGSLLVHRDVDLRWLVATFRRRLWLFLTVLGLTVAGFVVFVVLYPPDYTATARVVVIQRAINATPDKQSPVVSGLPDVAGQVNSEAQVIRSRRVALRVVQSLRLDQDPEFAGSHAGLKVALSRLLQGLLHAPRAVSPGDKVVDAVLANLSPERYLDTNAIDINYANKDPEKAQKIANAFAQAYLEDQVQAKVLRNRLVSDAFMGQLDDMRRQAQADSEKVQTYKIAHNLLGDGTHSLTEQEIAVDNQAVATARADAVAEQANLRMAQEQLSRGSSGEDVGAALNSPVVAALRAQRATLTGKLADLEGHYGPKYPNLAQAHREVASIDLEIQAEILRSISNLSAKAAVSQKRLASLQGTLSGAKQVLAENNAAQASLEQLVRTANVSQGIYEAYLQRFKESTAQLNGLTADAEIVSMAGLPVNPSFPDVWIFLMLGFVTGLLLGSAAVLVAETLEDRLNTADDVERKLGLPYLGAIPSQAFRRRGGGGTPSDVIVARPLGPYAEAFRGLLASVILRRPTDGGAVILVTSAHAGEGKSTIAAGLARTSALQGVSTVLIDSDIRGRGRGLARDFRLEDSGPGLIAVLNGAATLEEALRVDPETGVQVLPMSEDVGGSGGVIVGEAMRDLLTRLRRTYSAVFLDAPALSLAATRLLAIRADFTIVVTTWGEAPGEELTEAIRMAPFDQSAEIGVVLNRLDPEEQVRRGFALAEGAPRKASHLNA